MKNSEVISKFFEGKTGNTANLFSDGNTLINYQTVIAKRIPNETNIYLNKDRYSSTTSKIQNMIRNLAGVNCQIEEITEEQINKIA
jgi:hypothetical protein